MITYSNTIQWSPLSQKHIDYIKKAFECQMSVAEGAIRSGKTIDHCIIASMFLEICPDRIHLASGSTIANAKLNIGDCNGYGLEHIFRGRCKWGKYRDNEALYINTKTGKKIVIFAGGSKADSFKKILGNSYGLWIATEINQHYDSDNSETSFIKVAFGRQIASKKIMRLWDLNPSAPHHKIYEYIDGFKNNYIGGYNYQHFTIVDNLSISEERRKQIESQYDKNSVWYKRDILGERCIAEGLCYPVFADNPTRTYIDEQWMNEHRIQKITTGVDFGGDSSATTFVTTAIVDNYKYLVVLKSKRIKKRLDTDELTDLFRNYCVQLYNDYRRIFNTYCDSAESVLIHTLETTQRKHNLQCQIDYALKIEINQRIKALNSLIVLDRFKILHTAKESNDEVIDALLNASWDSTKKDKGDIRLDIVSYENPVDICDALEYSYEGEIDRLIDKERM